MSFGCTSCGLCCKIAKFIYDETPSPKEFPYAFLDDGTCSMLAADGRCTVYATRPEICRVKEKDYEATAAACNVLIKAVGMPDEYLVQIGGRK